MTRKEKILNDISGFDYYAAGRYTIAYSDDDMRTAIEKSAWEVWKHLWKMDPDTEPTAQFKKFMEEEQ